MAQQMVQVQQQVSQQQQHAAQSAQQMAAHAREVLAAQNQLRPMPMSALPVAGAGGGPTLVQRPDASPEENEMIARAQQAIAQAKAAGGVSPEVGAAVFRVEHRLGELSALIAQLQERIAQGAAAPARSHNGGNAGAGQVPRFDAAVDLQSPSNFYKWRPDADVVNEGGVFIATRRRVPQLGQQVILRLTLPGGVELEARAVVEWSRPAAQQGAPPGFGARFVDLPTYARQLVDHFVARRPPLVFEQA
jgi:uncharacterized protein (TIGR02266 family)